MKSLLMIFIVTVLGNLAVAEPQLPALDWERRSDWVSVKTDITPAAVGDGLADDTSAIQKGLDAMTDGSVLYLPAGTYRITDTLVNRHKSRLTGILIVGNGRNTRIVWDGKQGGRMFLADGASASRYVGIIFDGRDKAAIGLYHCSGPGHFETEVRHQHLAFLNFTDAGILTDRQPATAEVMTDNCLFENCKRGIAFLSFNDYNYTIDGCDFRRCQTAIECRHGNAYIRNCHFEASGNADIALMPEHGSSVRRCTSIGSKMFIQFANPVAPITIQDCHIARWTNLDGAIILNGAPVMLFDCVFTDPPGKKPPVKITGNRQSIFISGNESAETGDVIQADHQGRVYVVPQGRLKGGIRSAEQRFLKDKVIIPSVVFDAKRDFGAKGDRSTDDTASIQKTIDAARARGKGAIAYLPTGVYAIRNTLRITGGDYFVGGSGFRSGLLWTGPEGGTIVEVRDPDHVVLENLAIGNHDTGTPMKNGVDVLQTSSGGPSFMTYDNVTVFGMYQKDPDRKGLWLRGLSKASVVVTPQVQGNIHIVDSGQATILLTNSYEGSIVVEGKDRQREGFLGVLTHLGTISTYALYIKNNHSFVASDFYIEQAVNGCLFEGAAGDPIGRITLQGAKMHLTPGLTGNAVFEIHDYSGQIFVGPEQYYVEPVNMRLNHKGVRPLDIILCASCFYNTRLEIQKEDKARIHVVGNIAVSNKSAGYQAEDNLTSETLNKLSVNLDDLRVLGQLDLRLNHPEVQTSGSN